MNLIFHRRNKNGLAYFQLSGEYRGDEEHGLIVVMHEGRLMEYNQIGEDGYAGVYKDLGRDTIYDSIKSRASAIRRGAVIKIHEEWIRFYLSMGANPYALTPAGDDYKAVLKPAYFRKELEFQEVVEKIEGLIAGNKGVKLNWKF